MKHRLITILLTIAMVLSMTTLSFAVITPHLSINIDPTDGTYTLTATAEGAGDSPTYQWFECGSGGENPREVQGATSNVYEPTVAMETRYFFCRISNGTETASTEVASISDTSASKKPDETQTATATEGNVVSTFSVAGIEAPVTGEIPDQTAEIVTENDTPGYYVLSVRWDTELPTFVPETAYTATVLVNLSDGYQAAPEVSCFIDNNPATIVGDPASGSFAFYYTFPPTAVEEEPPSSNPIIALFQKAKGKVLELPAPLGIPAWIWGLGILILLIALISALTAHSRARQYDRGNRDYLDELYEETMAKRRSSEEEYEEYDEEYEEDEEYDEEADAQTDPVHDEADDEANPVHDEAEADAEEDPNNGPENDEGQPEEPEDPEDDSPAPEEPIERIYGK